MASQETIGKILLTQEQIRQRARELGEQITKDYAGEQLILVGTLRGAVPFMTDLMQNIHLDVRIDFVAASSYGRGTTSMGDVKIKKDLEMDICGKHVIIVEDIVDTGNTLKRLRDYFLLREPQSVRICTLLDKPSRRIADVQADYVGFTVENLFIVGYGLDYDQKYRNLPYVSYLEPEQQG